MDSLTTLSVELREFSSQDSQACVDLLNAYYQRIFGQDLTTLEDFVGDLTFPRFNPQEDMRLAYTSEGKLVGYIDFYDGLDTHIHPQCFGRVHPDFFGMGIGTQLLEWAERRSQKCLELAPEGLRVSMSQGIPAADNRAAELLSNRGYKHTRNYYRMMIDLEHRPTEPVIPEGIEIRPMKMGEDRVVIQAIQDAFLDHYGFVEEPFEDFYARWKHRMETDPRFNPDWWLVAWDSKSKEVAGASLNWHGNSEDSDLGFVNMLGVRRAWRKNGVGMALLQSSFQLFFQNGLPRAGLGVDASSLTGATRLYERAGMRVVREYHSYVLELRAGNELGTVKV